jgi:hypothetical protein
MTSLRQIAANRHNAHKSAGHNTEEGKQRSRRNAFLGELRRGAWPIRVGDNTFPLRYESDLFDPANSRLWLCFPFPDKAGKPHLVRQEVVLAQGGGRLWFVHQGWIDVTLTLHGDRFQIPRPRFPSKPPCLPPPGRLGQTSRPHRCRNPRRRAAPMSRARQTETAAPAAARAQRSSRACRCPAQDSTRPGMTIERSTTIKERRAGSQTPPSCRCATATRRRD